MATGRKGKGTAVRRRTKSEANQVTVHESNGKPTNNGASETAPTGEVNVEIIRVRAYELFVARGASHGDDLADWFNAEKELRGGQRP
jgi:hypothetical protein